MGFLLVPKSVTLNYLERRNDRYLAFLSPNLVALGANYVQVVEDGLPFRRRRYVILQLPSHSPASIALYQVPGGDKRRRRIRKFWQ